MRVPFLDLHASYLELKNEIDSSIARVLSSGMYVGGSEVETFEDNFSDYCGSEFTVGVANGLDALRLSLRVLDVGPGDEVIVPANTFIATWLAVTEVGATPVPVEPNAFSYNINTDEIQQVLTSKTKAIIPVHLFGQPADLEPILLLAKNFNLYVIEDAAQAAGSKYKDRRIGAHGDLVCWSFYPGKNLGAFGDAGAITTDNPALAEKLFALRNYGSAKKYSHKYIGINSRLDPMQACILDLKLKHLDEWNNRRKKIASFYSDALASHSLIQLPHVPEWAEPVWHLFVIQTPQRDLLQSHLAKHNIETIIHYPIPPHQQDAYKGSVQATLNLSITENLSKNILSLPMGPHLSEIEQHYVVQCINNF